MLNQRGTIDRRKLATQVTLLEGGYITTNAGQVAEILRLAFRQLAAYDNAVLIETIREYEPYEDAS